MLFILLIAGVVLWLIANNLVKKLYFNTRFYWIGGALAVLFLTAFFFESFYVPANILLVIYFLAILADVGFIF